jgi:hypothetical protein
MLSALRALAIAFYVTLLALCVLYALSYGITTLHMILQFQSNIYILFLVIVNDCIKLQLCGDLTPMLSALRSLAITIYMT